MRRQRGAVRFPGQVDRVYGPTRRACVVQDAVSGRRIKNVKRGSATTVVWNPWVEKSAGFSDMAAGEYLKMVCVETANAAGQAVTLGPGAVHVMGAELRVG